MIAIKESVASVAVCRWKTHKLSEIRKGTLSASNENLQCPRCVRDT